MAAEAVHLYGCTKTIKEFSAAAALTPGEVLVVGNRVGVVSGTKPIAIGEDYTLQMDGVFDMPILGTDTPAKGALLYWDAGNNRLTTTASTHKSAGLAVETKANGPTRIKCDLNASVASATV
jgi:predicted RecA/RadA family phage recombinase